MATERPREEISLAPDIGEVLWEGGYATREPLLDTSPEGCDGDYGYIAYIELR